MYGDAAAVETLGGAAAVVLAAVDGAVLVPTVARGLFAEDAELVVPPAADRPAGEVGAGVVAGCAAPIAVAVIGGLLAAALLDVVSTGSGSVVVALSGT